MLRTSKIIQPVLHQTRSVMMAAAQTHTEVNVKREGDISDSFVSLSGTERPPLPQRFLDLKKTLVAGHEDQVTDSWKRLLERLRVESDAIAKVGPKIIPDIDFDNLDSDLVRFGAELKKRGVAVIRNVVPEKEARAYKDEIEEYARQNPSTRGMALIDATTLSERYLNVKQHSLRTTRKYSSCTGRARRSRLGPIPTS